MKIREAKEIDIPAIVDVLKSSLGEDQLELSEQVWRYKHIDNPFGKSIVLVAIENEKIIGVRAFMRWKWQKGTKMFSALRAVDTATHPDQQGKGIFKNLTLRAVELAKTQGDHFIFNTPNEQSRPGYLKMGWEQVGKIYIGLRPSFSVLSFKKNPQVYEVVKHSSQDEIEELCLHWNRNLEAESGLFTPKSAEMLRWRYEENPLQSYEVEAGKGYYFAAYVKRRGKLREFRIAEFIYNKNLIDRHQLKKILQRQISRVSCHIISFSPNLLKLRGKKGNLGPVLTFNALNLSTEEKDYGLKIYHWNNSLGDLELF